MAHSGGSQAAARPDRGPLWVPRTKQAGVAAADTSADGRSSLLQLVPAASAQDEELLQGQGRGAVMASWGSGDDTGVVGPAVGALAVWGLDASDGRWSQQPPPQQPSVLPAGSAGRSAMRRVRASDGVEAGEKLLAPHNSAAMGWLGAGAAPGGAYRSSQGEEESCSEEESEGEEEEARSLRQQLMAPSAAHTPPAAASAAALEPRFGGAAGGGSILPHTLPFSERQRQLALDAAAANAAADEDGGSAESPERGGALSATALRGDQERGGGEVEEGGASRMGAVERRLARLLRQPSPLRPRPTRGRSDAAAGDGAGRSELPLGTGVAQGMRRHGRAVGVPPGSSAAHEGRGSGAQIMHARTALAQGAALQVRGDARGGKEGQA